MKIREIHAHAKKTEKPQKTGCGNLKSFLAFLIGIFIAACGILLPKIFFSNETDLLLGRQSAVSVLSSDSVQTVTRDTSFTLEDYAYITEMTMSGDRYYSEPVDAQLTMREASNAAGEILKMLLPQVFTGDVHQPYTLTSAILTSNVQSSEENYDYRQSFWYVDITYPDDVNDLPVSSTINSVNGKAWSAVATFPVDRFADNSYGIRVADAILENWNIPLNVFYAEDEETELAATVHAFPVNTQSTESDSSAAVEGGFYAEYLADDGVLIYNASDYFTRLENVIETMDGLSDSLTDFYTNYLEYLGILNEAAEGSFSVEILFDDDLWYNTELETCRELVALKDALHDAAVAEYNIFAKMYDSENVDVDTILLDCSTYEESLILMTLAEYPYALDISLVATDATSGLSVTVSLQTSYDEQFAISVSLGI